MKILIENSTKKNDIVLDPFMGSGSTGVGCVNTGRDFIGIEIDTEKTKGKNKDQSYFDIAKERIEKATKEKETTFFI
jgi:DNA modification methylase